MSPEEPREFNLLTLCALRPLSPEGFPRFRATVSRPIQWNEFLRLAKRHGLGPTVYANVRDHFPDGVPAAVLSELRAEYEKNRVHALVLMNAWRELADAFESLGIPFAGLKGVLLSQKLYGDYALRQSADLDVLIPRHSAQMVHALLLQKGFHAKWPSRSMTSLQWQLHLRLQHHNEYFRPRDGILLEPHWSILRPFLLPDGLTREMLSRLQRIPCAHRDFPFLSDEDTLIHLLAHGARHAWASLRWLVDIAVLLRVTPGIQTDRVRRTMVNLGLERCYDQGMLLVRECFPAPAGPTIPDLPEAGPGTADLLGSVRAVWESPVSQFGFRNRTQRGAYLFRVTGFQTRLRKNPGAILALFGWVWIDPDDWSDFPLPDLLFPLYLLWHPFLKLQRRMRKRKAAHGSRRA